MRWTVLTCERRCVLSFMSYIKNNWRETRWAAAQVWLKQAERGKIK